mmetsp:Transcript_56824/g.120857  ORF Transcript_56824/g.120857 Transcript_56824/m.120857 type:complete len:92 (+) Transcript_56824:127-402(+)
MADAAAATPKTPTPDGELMLNSSGVIQKCDGDWQGQQDEIAATVWKMLKEVKFISVGQGESMERLYIKKDDVEYVVTGKDCTYYILKYIKS